MKLRLKRRLSSAKERGAVMFLVAGTILVVLLAGALAVDLSIVATRGQDLQNAADSAALAGVQAYRQSIGEGNIADADDVAAAEAAVAAILAQNGITDITPVVTFPDTDFNTEVTVTLVEDDTGTILSGVTGGKSSVSRSATARFERCDDGCVKTVEIPEPFRGVDAEGDGDGYKPIPVGDRLYSINHNSGSIGNAGGTAQITCVDRVTQLGCWAEVDDAGNVTVKGVSRPAYPNGYVPLATPEMPHAAVVEGGDVIFWASSLSNDAHYMFCWQASTDTPCSSPREINSNASAIYGSQVGDARLIHRGGGTVAAGSRIFTFTDDHRVHCVQATISMPICAGYTDNGKPTGLHNAGFPANDPNRGQHGSSIDRVLADDGKIYSTLHIKNAALNLPPGCSNLYNGNLQSLNVGQIVVLRNVSSDIFMGIDPRSLPNVGTYGAFRDETDSTNTDAHFIVENNDGAYALRSVGADDAGAGPKYISFPSEFGDVMTPSPNKDVYSKIYLGVDQTVSTIESYFRKFYNGAERWLYMSEAIDPANPTGLDTAVVGGAKQPEVSEWIVQEPQCANPDDVDGVPSYKSGTFLHCFDTTSNAPCSSFISRRIHADASSFSGRLFFFYGAGDPDSTVPELRPDIKSICSTGFSEQWTFSSNLSDRTQLRCYDAISGVRGAVQKSQEADMSSFTSALAATNTGSWGTWGDPHYNEATNRLFYPTHRRSAQVLCYDFDDGWCGQIDAKYSPLVGANTQDYGFYSDDKCVFALGHNAAFWAFQADSSSSNLGEQCTGSSRTTVLTPCNCGGELYWGSIDFDVDINAFTSFEIEIFNQAGGRVWPRDPLVPPHSLHDDGSTIDLNFVPIVSASDQLIVKVDVEADGNPWSEGGQFFTIELARAPQLTE